MGVGVRGTTCENQFLPLLISVNWAHDNTPWHFFFTTHISCRTSCFGRWMVGGQSSSEWTVRYRVNVSLIVLNKSQCFIYGGWRLLLSGCLLCLRWRPLYCTRCERNNLIGMGVGADGGWRWRRVSKLCHLTLENNHQPLTERKNFEYLKIEIHRQMVLQSILGTRGVVMSRNPWTLITMGIRKAFQTIQEMLILLNRMFHFRWSF